MVKWFWTLDELALKSEVGIRKSEHGLKQAFFGGFSAFRLPISDFDTGFGRVYASVQSPKPSNHPCLPDRRPGRQPFNHLGLWTFWEMPFEDQV